MRLRVLPLLVVPVLALVGLPPVAAAAAVAAPAVGTVFVNGRAPGNVVRASGTGFDAGAAVTVTLVGAGVSVALTSSAADDAGAVAIPPGTRLPVSVAPGTYRLTMSETDGPSATSPQFVLVAPTALVPATMAAGQPATQSPGGTPIQLEGLSDGPGVDRTVTVDRRPVETDWTGGNGTIRGANIGFAVPADTKVGDHSVTFTQTGPTPFTVTRTVRVAPPDLHLEGSPTSSMGRLGVTVFDPGWDDVVDVQVVGAAGDVHTFVFTGDDFRVGGVITLPGVSAGLATVTSVSRHNGASARATVTVDPATVTSPGGLAPGQRVVTADGNDEIDMQTDGNLVQRSYGRYAEWSSRTQGHPGARLSVQTDGNVVIRDVDGRALWNTGTAGIGTGTRFALDPTFGPTVFTATGRRAWSSFTPFGGDLVDRLAANDYLFKGQSVFANLRGGPGGAVYLALGGDGNVVVRTTFGGALWSTRTAGHTNAYLILQTDGNLVLRAPNGTAIWANGVRGVTGARLVAQSDGNVVEYAPNGKALWSTRTHVS